MRIGAGELAEQPSIHPPFTSIDNEALEHAYTASLAPATKATSSDDA